jgi:hypothetical protein
MTAARKPRLPGLMIRPVVTGSPAAIGRRTTEPTRSFNLTLSLIK